MRDNIRKVFLGVEEIQHWCNHIYKMFVIHSLILFELDGAFGIPVIV
jgi:hypothetical protein